jgi:2,3-bisphosphoglycerate-independent phosphoglycerate mutase
MKKPIVLIIMDGVGKGDGGSGDAVAQAKTPNLDHLLATCPHNWLKAHGTAVGLPSDDDMGNSEVGHNALGCGQIYSQGAKLVNESIQNGTLFASDTWKELIANAKQEGKALHFLGLLSDGNVHSNISHLIAMLRHAHAEGVKRVYCHILLDGRDVPATSALDYVKQLEDVLAELRADGSDYRIASGGGRMQITMDRYEANWPMVEVGWRTHVQGIGRQFASAKEAIETYRAETGCIDQDLPAFVIAENGKPVAKIANGDSVILYNFRGDRAQEISLAFDRKDFDKFDRGDYTGVKFAGMLEYDGDLKIPTHYLVQPPVIKNTLTELLCKHGLSEYAVSETQKYGHVTYFWNGNRSGKVDEKLETYEEIPSDVIPFEQEPAMKSREITDHMIAAMESKKYDFLRCNFPNGDMVGHTGVISAVITAMECVDESVGRIIKAADRLGYLVLVTADHGNADQMTETKKGKTSIRTAHSLNPVPFIIYDPNEKHELKEGKFGLANVAPTVATLLGLEKPACWEESMV